MIADGMVNMDLKTPARSDTEHNPDTATTKDQNQAIHEEEKDADADDHEADTVDEVHEETEQKEVACETSESDKHTESTSVAAITQSDERIDTEHLEAQQEEAETTNQIGTMETEYQPKDMEDAEDDEDAEIVETVTKEVTDEDNPAVSEKAALADEPQPEEDGLKPQIEAVLDELIAQQCEEPMKDCAVANYAVEIAASVTERHAIDEKPNEDEEQDTAVFEDVDVDANEESPETLPAPQPQKEENIDAESEVVANAEDQEMDEPKDKSPEIPGVGNAEEQQAAPTIDTTAEPGIEDDEFIIKTVLSFIEVNPDEINMRFDTETHGDNLQFADGRTVSKINDDLPSICVFGQAVNAERCKECDIEVQWKASASEEGGFHMGYLTKPKEDIQCWNSELGSILCLDSVGYYVYGGCGYFKELRDGNCHEIGYRAPTNLKVGDTMRMIVDFTKDTVTLRHNGKMAAICPLYGHKEITPAFSLGLQGEEIEVLSCQMK